MDTLTKYRQFLGQEVNVVIDRPFGSLHPKFDTEYKTNYGYVANTLAGDGREIDAYILGPGAPLASFRGKCIAVICRLNDVEHKLVVSNDVLSKAEIQAQTDFIERYFETSIEMFDA